MRACSIVWAFSIQYLFAHVFVVSKNGKIATMAENVGYVCSCAFSLSLSLSLWCSWFFALVLFCPPILSYLSNLSSSYGKISWFSTWSSTSAICKISFGKHTAQWDTCHWLEHLEYWNVHRVFFLVIFSLPNYVYWYNSLPHIIDDERMTDKTKEKRITGTIKNRIERRKDVVCVREK